MKIAIERGRPKAKVSVIIPIHNSEKYLRECLTSAVAQTFDDIEVLCIDTGSSKQCFELIMEMKKSDDRIGYIADSNGSYGHKINVGIKAAKGDYIAILESDDRMAPDMVERLYAVAQEYNADVIDGDFDQVFDYKGKDLYVSCHKYSDAQVYDRLIRNENGPSKVIATNGIWTALYRKDFLLRENIWLNESPGASYQDMSFLFLTSLLARTSYHLRAPVYWYRVDNIGSSVKDNSKIYEILGECAFLKNELEKRSMYGQCQRILYLKVKYSAYYWNCCRLSERARELFLVRYLEELRNDIEASTMARDMFDENMYQMTFLLLDDLAKFKELVAESDRHQLVEGLCALLDQVRDQEIVIFGAGALGARALNVLHQNKNKILGVCDNAKHLQGTVLYGFEVCSVKETAKKYPCARYVIANRKHGEEMKVQLLSEGISEANIEVFS